mgnify:CR=1 FL=1
MNTIGMIIAFVIISLMILNAFRQVNKENKKKKKARNEKNQGFMEKGKADEKKECDRRSHFDNKEAREKHNILEIQRLKRQSHECETITDTAVDKPVDNAVHCRITLREQNHNNNLCNSILHLCPLQHIHKQELYTAAKGTGAGKKDLRSTTRKGIISKGGNKGNSNNVSEIRNIPSFKKQ